MNWWSLRRVGNIAVLKVSYAALIAIPFLTRTDVGVLGFKPWLLADVFFASLLLALANLIYDTSCPSVVKRFASPNDLYHRMLAIRKLSAALYPNDSFDASLKHCTDKYKQDSASRPILRHICSASYVLSGGLFLCFFANRSWIVLRNLF